MDARGAATLAMASILVPFVVRTVNTASPGLIDSNAKAAMARGILFLAAIGLAVALAVLADVFRTRFRGPALAFRMAGIGAAVAAAAHLMRFLDVSTVNPIESGAYQNGLDAAAAVLPSASLLVVFGAVVAWRERGVAGRRSALAGAVILAAVAVLRATGGAASVPPPLLWAVGLLAFPALVAELWCLASLRQRLQTTTSSSPPALR